MWILLINKYIHYSSYVRTIRKGSEYDSRRSRYKRVICFYNKSNKQGIKMLISTFIKENISWYNDKLNLKLKTPIQVNALNRYEIADAFIRKRTKNGKNIHDEYQPTRQVTNQEVMKHIEEYIDLVIPRHYFVLATGKLKGCYNNISDIPDLKFVFEENYDREKVSIIRKEGNIKKNKLFCGLNRPYKNFDDYSLIEIIKNDAWDKSYKIITNLCLLSRLELLELLHFLYYGRKMENVDNYLKQCEKEEQDDIEINNGLDVSSSLRTLDRNIKLKTFRTEFVRENILGVEIGTTGYKGGDSGYGGRTYFALRDFGSTDMRVRVNAVDQIQETNSMEIVFGGDAELNSFIDALEFALHCLK
jgi:hypothetical protein